MSRPELGDMPVRRTKCKTCPFRAGSPLACLAPDLTMSALTEGSRICHSTGIGIDEEDTGKPERICRGARDVQIDVMHGLGLLDEPTDADWEAKRKLFCPQPEAE